MKKLSDLKIVPADPRVKKTLNHEGADYEFWVQPISAGMRESVMLQGDTRAPNSALMAASFFDDADAKQPVFTTDDLAMMSNAQNAGLWDKLFNIYADVNGLLSKKKS